MRTVLMFDPSVEGAEIAAWLEKNKDLHVIYDKKYGIFTNHLFTARYDLIVTELEIEGVREGDLLKNTSQQTQNVFQVCITNCRDVFKITFAETNQIRHLLFKPVNYDELSIVIDETICGKKTFLVAASDARAKYIASTVENIGHFVQIVQREYELNRIFHERSIDYVIYDDSFDIPKPDDFFKKLDMLNKNHSRSIAILKTAPDGILRTTLESHLVEKILPGNVLGEAIVIVLEEFLRKQPVIEKDREKKAEILEERERKEKEKQEELEKLKKQRAEESRAREEEERKKEELGKFSVIRFVKELEAKFYDQALIEPVKDYLRTRNPESGDSALDLLRSSKGQPILLLLCEAFIRADSHFKELLLDIFTEVESPVIINTLLMALKDREPDVRFLALLGLQNKKDERIKTFVAFRLLDDNPKVRKMAVKILEETTDLQVVKTMVDAFRKYGDGNIAKSLIFVLENKVKIADNLKFVSDIYPFVPRDVKEVIINEFIKTGKKEVIPFLLREMKSKDDMISRLSVDGLEKIKDPMAIPDIVDYLKANDSFYIQDTVHSLLETVRSKKYLPLLEKVIVDGTSGLKEAAIEIIKDMSGKEALFLLLKALGEPTPSVKMAAIDALALRKKKFVVPSLIYLLDDKNAIVRDRAIDVLKSMIDKDDIEVLVAFFRRATTEEARETVADFLHTLISDKDQTALEKLLRKDSFHLLLEIMQRKGLSLGKYTTAVLGEKFASDEAYDAIIKTLYSNSDDARSEALLALGKIANPAALPHIIKALDDKTWFIRRNALEALKSYRNPKTVAYAEKLMEDENPGVRLSAVEFLSMMNMRYRERALQWAVSEDSVKVLRKIPQLLAPFKDQELANVYKEKMDAAEPIVRIQSARKLLELWESVDYSFFTRNITHANWRLRLFSFMILCDRNIEEAEKHIDALMHDAVPEVRRELPEIFYNVFHGRALPHIRKIALDDEDLQVRKSAVKLLPSFDLDDQMKQFFHELLEKESNNSGLMEIGFALDAMDYELPREVLVLLENKFPNELKQIISAIHLRHQKE